MIHNLLFVEGEEDKNFLKSYLEHIGYSTKFEIQSVGGKDNLKGIKNDVEYALEAVLKTRTAFEKLSNQPPDASQNAPYHRYIHPICLIFYFCFRAYNNFKTAF